MLVVEKDSVLMKLKYFSELKRSMEYLANKKTLFIGQAVQYPGTAMYNTLSTISKTKVRATRG